MGIRGFTVWAVLGLAAGAGAASASVGALPCTPVDVAWPAPAGWYDPASGPDLTVLDTDIRPGRSRVYLDGRYVGVADSFDGRPDYLYLEPGTYRLEARLGGYRTLETLIEAEPGCRVDIRHWMERIRGEPKERRGTAPPSPDRRIWSPVDGEEPSEPVSAERGRTGPDESLRPDVGASGGPDRPHLVGESGRSSLRLTVEPDTAAVYLDGEFVAVARQLHRMEAPLVIGAGEHVLDVLAPGHVAETVILQVGEGEPVELDLALERKDGNGG